MARYMFLNLDTLKKVYGDDLIKLEALMSLNSEEACLIWDTKEREVIKRNHRHKNFFEKHGLK